MATTKYEDLINQFITERREQTKIEVVMLDQWHAPDMRKEEFWAMLQASAQAFMAKRGVYRPFIVDDFNREIILQMYLYVKGDMECKWNIHKGIYLGGKVGCGKTLLLQALCDILHLVSGYYIEMIPANYIRKYRNEASWRLPDGRSSSTSWGASNLRSTTSETAYAPSTT